MSVTEKCENCGKAIGNLETARVWQDHVICAKCDGVLRTDGLKQSKQIALRPISFAVAGVSHANDNGTSRQAAIKGLRVGEGLTFRHDTGNKYSSTAVAVFAPSGRQIGFVPDDSSENVLKLMAVAHNACVERLLPPNENFPNTYGVVVAAWPMDTLSPPIPPYASPAVMPPARPLPVSSVPGTPVCQQCGAGMVKKTISSGNAGGIALALIVFVIGLAISLTIVGAIIGVPLMILSLFMGGKRTKIWKCTACGAYVPRV